MTSRHILHYNNFEFEITFFDSFINIGMYPLNTLRHPDDQIAEKDIHEFVFRAKPKQIANVIKKMSQNKTRFKEDAKNKINQVKILLGI